MIRRFGAAPWLILVVVAGAIAGAALARWLWAVTLDGPVLYGEGAVAHAAILARGRLEYVDGARYGDIAPIFTAANYPPLFFNLAGLGDPFIAGRVLSGAATLAVAAAIAWRARSAGTVVAAGLALSWLAMLPLVVWGVAVKPDLVALGLTVAALVALDRRSPFVGGMAMALAAGAKPTELLPAASFAIALLARREMRGLAAYAGGFVLAAIGVALLVVGAGGDPLRHILDWNALAFHVDQAALLGLIAIVILGVPLFAVVLARSGSPFTSAYLIAAAVIVLLGGREGATINYLLDLTTASFMALAGIAARLRASGAFPIALALELAIVMALFDPFGIVGRSPGTGAWAAPSRLATVRGLARPALVEDSGLVVASGVEPIVDDLFLWSRLYERDASFAEGGRLLDAVRARRFATVVSEADLEHLDTAPAYERQRWAGALVSAVLDAYRLDRHEGALWVYVPR